MVRLGRVLLALALLAALGSFGYWKYAGVNPFGRAITQVAAATQGVAAEETAPEPADAEPRKEPADKLQTPAAEDLPPHLPELKPLAKTVQIPEKRMPVVYLAPVRGAEDKVTSAADQVDNVLRFQLRACTAKVPGLNLIPLDYVRLPYARAFSHNVYQEQNRDRYVEDAKALGADFCVLARTNAELPNPGVDLEVVDLATSESKRWSSSGSAAGNNLLGDVAAECARLCGLSDEEISTLRIADTGVSADLWSKIVSVSVDEATTAAIGELARQYPDCGLLYVEGRDAGAPLKLNRDGLTRWPEDLRLMCSLATELSGMDKGAAALAVTGYVIEQAPDYLYAYYRLHPTMSKSFKRVQNAKEISVEHQALLDQHQQLMDKFSKNWYLGFQYSLASSHKGWVLRGTQTIDKIPGEMLEKRALATEEALKAAELAYVYRADCPAVLAQVLEANFDEEKTDLDWQRGLIRQVHDVDPRNTQLEIRAIFSHSAGWGDVRDFLKLADEASRNHKGDARALEDVLDVLVIGLSRMVGFKQWSEEEAYEQPNPLADRVLALAEEIYGLGGSVHDAGNDWLVHKLLKAHGKQELLKQVTDDGRNITGVYFRAGEFHQQGKFKECEEAARRTLLRLEDVPMRERAQYYVIKSLWKLKRYEESMNESRKAIREFPEKQMPYYMFAIVADEAGQNLEEAFGHAYKAVEIDQGNQGCNETFERLRKRLGKGPHPRLAS